MVYSGTQLVTEDGETLKLSELVAYLKKAKEFKDIYKIIERLEHFEAVALVSAKAVKDFYRGDKVNNDDTRLSDAREAKPHRHNLSDIEGIDALLGKDEAKRLIDSVSKDLSLEISKLPKKTQAELKVAIRDLKAELGAKISGIEKRLNIPQEKPDLSKIDEVEAQLKDVVDLIDGVIDKAEDDLRDVQERLLKDMTDRLQEKNGQVNIIGGINIGERLKLLKDVDVENVTNGQYLAYNSTTGKWEAVNGSGGGSVNSVVGTTNQIDVDNTDAANPIVSLASAVTTSLALADSALQSGDNVSELTNNVGYITSYTETDTLGTVTGRGASTSIESTFSGGLVTNQVKANSSAGGILKSNSGSACMEWGAGGGQNVTFADGVKLNAGTADRILGTDSNKNIQYLSTATYPSLTELSYVKGLTSAAQTQINGKQDTLVSGTNIKTINSTTILGSGNIAVATTAQGALADSALQAAAIGVTVQGYSSVLAATTASFTTADETKLDGIEAGADITDATNVAAAGAVMTSEKGAANGVAPLGSDSKISTSYLPAAVLGAANYQGVWNASTNTPTLTSSTGTKGFYYVVDIAGSTNLDGITDWKLGDWAIFNGSAWEKVDNTDAVISVNSQIGAVVLDADDISDSSTTNKFTNDTDITRLANTSGTNTGDQDLSSYATTSAVAAGYQPLATVLTNTTASFTTAQETKLSGIETGAEVNNISDANATDLTDGGDSTLHYHASDRNRANHTGTQLASTISDFDTAVAANAAVAANTAKVTNATHTGEVTGSGALTLDKTAFSNKPFTTIAAGDAILFSDSSDGSNLKRATASDVANLYSDDGLRGLRYGINASNTIPSLGRVSFNSLTAASINRIRFSFSDMSGFGYSEYCKKGVAGNFIKIISTKSNKVTILKVVSSAHSFSYADYTVSNPQGQNFTANAECVISIE